jgi:hypothetical protein
VLQVTIPWVLESVNEKINIILFASYLNEWYTQAEAKILIDLYYNFDSLFLDYAAIREARHAGVS